MKRSNWGYAIGLLILIITISALFMYRPVTLHELSTIEGFEAYTRSFGPVMPIATLLIAGIQAVVPVIPFIILCSANGVLFGLTVGILLTWSGTLAGASLTFFVARKLGYEWAARKYSKASLKRIDEINGIKGFIIILTLRLLPYFPAPLINVMAGVSRINFFWFFLASAVGKLPFIIGYTVVGYSLLHNRNYGYLALIMVAIIAIPYLISRKTRKKSPQPGRE